jgi:hypothetical protein
MGFMASFIDLVDSDWLGTLKSVERAIFSENSFEYFVNGVLHSDFSILRAAYKDSGRSLARRNRELLALDWW